MFLLAKCFLEAWGTNAATQFEENSGLLALPPVVFGPWYPRPPEHHLAKKPLRDLLNMPFFATFQFTNGNDWWGDPRLGGGRQVSNDFLGQSDDFWGARGPHFWLILGVPGVRAGLTNTYLLAL